MTFGYRQYKQIATSYDTLGRVVQARSAAPKGNVTVSTAHTYFGAPEATRTILGRSDTTYTFETVHTYNISLQQTLCRYNSYAGKSKANNKFNAENGAGSDSQIVFNPYFISENGDRPSFIGLAHELIHSLHNADGTAYYDKNGNQIAVYEESRTVGLQYNEGDEPTENHIRKENGIPARTKYN